MANTRILHQSFASGEISPEMFGRLEDSAYQSGLATCRNFITKPQGPAENRAGFRFVREVKDSTKAVRIIPFTYSTTQTMVIELGAGYFRFHTESSTLEIPDSISAWTGTTSYDVGALVKESGKNYYCTTAHTSGTFVTDLSAGKWYEITTEAYEIPNPYAVADLFDIHYVQSADVLTLVHPNYAPRELRRESATAWVLSIIDFIATIFPPSNVTLSQSGLTEAKYSNSYVVTSLDAEDRESIASSEGISDIDIIEVTTNTSGVMKYDTTYVKTVLRKGNIFTVSGIIGMTELNGRTFKVSRITDPREFTFSELDSDDEINTSGYTPYDSAGIISTNYLRSNLFETGCTNTVDWTPVVGANKYRVYKKSGGVYGYIGETPELTLIDDDIAPDLSIVPPIYDDVFSGAGDYPGAVSYCEQRRAFAGTDNQPQNLWMTKTGTEQTMSYSIPTREDDRIAIRVAAREANTIRHIVPISQLILLTSAAEWRVMSVNSDAITPSSISVKPQSYVGSSNVQPSIVNNSMIYCAARGGHVRELGYDWQASGFVTGDMSLRAAHLFDSYEIVDMCYSKAPLPVLWFVSSSGLLLGFTYVPEQSIGAWHSHDTDGTFESCTTVAEGDTDVLYVVVKREIDGVDVRYIECMASRYYTAQEDAFFVDSGLTYDGSPVTAITGLDHLEGKTVSVLADGAVHPQQIVADGAINLDNEASVVHVGLAITSDLQTLPMAINIDGYGQGRYKNVNKAWLRVYQSSGILIGPDVNSLREYKQRTTEAYGVPSRLMSDEILVMMSPSWGNSGQLTVRQSDPLPLTIVSLTLEVTIGG